MRYRCSICGEIYDEEVEGVPFADLPEDWKCPVCGATKSDFIPIEERKPVKPRETKPAPVIEDSEECLVGLTPGELATVCSNLARGCEKQYRFEEQRLFMELSEYFDSVTPSVKDATAEMVSAALMSDLEDSYPIVGFAGNMHNDRGALRVKVWGEKVTKILDTLVESYLERGEEILEGTQIWVCTVCGFTYIGDKPPELCPVCKVPSWKFERIEGKVRA